MKLMFRKDTWYRVEWKDYKGNTHKHCVRVVTPTTNGYLFWFRRGPNDPKDEFCMGIRKENIISTIPYGKSLRQHIQDPQPRNHI